MNKDINKMSTAFKIFKIKLIKFTGIRDEDGVRVIRYD